MIFNENFDINKCICIFIEEFVPSYWRITAVVSSYDEIAREDTFKMFVETGYIHENSDDDFNLNFKYIKEMNKDDFINIAELDSSLISTYYFSKKNLTLLTLMYYTELNYPDLFNIEIAVCSQKIKTITNIYIYDKNSLKFLGDFLKIDKFRAILKNRHPDFYYKQVKKIKVKVLGYETDKDKIKQFYEEFGIPDEDVLVIEMEK